MKRPIDTAFATALLLALVTAVPAAAQDSPPDASSAEDAEWIAAEDEPLAAEAASAEDAPPDDLADEPIAEENDTASASESEQIKGKLKRFLIGLLLPAVERRVREAVDDDGSSPESDAEQELAVEYPPESEP